MQTLTAEFDGYYPCRNLQSLVHAHRGGGRQVLSGPTAEDSGAFLPACVRDQNAETKGKKAWGAEHGAAK